MPFFLRKAFKIGPFRLNLSKSGLGLSFGVTGARVGVRPDGRTYSHAGRFGLYHRQELGKLGEVSNTSDPDLKITPKIEGIRARLKILIDRNQAYEMLNLVQQKGNTTEAKIEILEAVSTSPKFWNSFHKKRPTDQKEWDETIDLLWDGIFEQLRQQGHI